MVGYKNSIEKSKDGGGGGLEPPQPPSISAHGVDY